MTHQSVTLSSATWALNARNESLAFILADGCFDVWAANLPRIEVYGSEGSLIVPDPNTFGGTVRLRTADDPEWRERIDAAGLDVRLEIDGGVTADNLDEVASTGVDMVVATPGRMIDLLERGLDPSGGCCRWSRRRCRRCRCAAARPEARGRHGGATPGRRRPAPRV